MSNDRTPCDACLRDDCVGRCCTRCHEQRGVPYDGRGDGGTWCKGCLAPPTATEPCPRCGSSSYLGVAPVCGACVAAMAEQPAKPSPAWVWTDYGTGARGYLGDADARAAGKGFHVTITDHDSKMVASLYEPLGDGFFLEIRTPLPAWSLAQCKRWVEQWVASQSDATVAAYEAAEGMR